MDRLGSRLARRSDEVDEAAGGRLGEGHARQAQEVVVKGAVFRETSGRSAAGQAVPQHVEQVRDGDADLLL